MKTLPNAYQLDVFKEIVNTGVGKAAAALNAMLESHIDLAVPSIILFQIDDPKSDLAHLLGTEMSCVQLDFRGSFGGTAALVFPPKSAVKLVASLTGEDPGTPYLNAVMAGTLNEVGNILINGVIGTIGNILKRSFDFSLPNYLEGRLEELLKLEHPSADLTVLLIRTQFKIQDRQVEGSIFLIFEMGSFEAFFTALENLTTLH
jgi:chemotaxis protein CheC